MKVAAAKRRKRKPVAVGGVDDEFLSLFLGFL
jgi:hypothetical protein